MSNQLRPALVTLAAMTLITGVAYPLVVTGVAQAAFRHKANGSLLVKNGKPVGSSLIGQEFSEPKYFWGRLSATGPVPYDSAVSSGSNYGPQNPSLHDAVKARVRALRDADPEATGPVPVDLVTASGSGLDPHISPAAAELQVRRVAKARGMDAAKVRSLVLEHTRERELGILGEPVVNVLELNLALDGS